MTKTHELHPHKVLAHSIQHTLDSQSHQLEVPAALDQVVLKQIERLPSTQNHLAGTQNHLADAQIPFNQNKKRKMSFVRVLQLAAVVSAVLMIVAFVSPTEYSDRIFGSFQELKRSFQYATMEMYQDFGFKLSGAESKLGDQYPVFETYIQELAKAKVDFSNSNGDIPFDQLHPTDRASVTELYRDLQPYLDQLNYGKSVQEMVSAQEYERYLQANIDVESIRASYGFSMDDDYSHLPNDVKINYEQSKQLLERINEWMINAPQK